MQNTPAFDILIVGSGPAGVQAAVEAMSHGLKVGLVEIGFSGDSLASRIPEKPFWDIRRSEPAQGDYLLGDPQETLRNLTRAGPHLTPPRRYMIRSMEELLPMKSSNFIPLQSTSSGGLGVSWGSNVFTFEDFELAKAGLPPAEIREQYQQLSADIGVSGGREDDVTSSIANVTNLQPPLELDSNAKSIFRNYGRRRRKLNQRGFIMGRSALAVLSLPLGDRRPNSYWDMDFYSDAGQSVYRPQFTLAALKKLDNFTHLPGRLVLSFEENSGATVEVACRNLGDGSLERIVARKLILAAGAINSGRLVLCSFPNMGRQLSILCNPNVWIAAINLSMLGRPAADARYSLAQLTALQHLEQDGPDYAVVQFYSYRSLMHFRLLPGIPLPPKLGVTFLRLISTALTCVNVHFSDSPAPSKWLRLDAGNNTPLIAHYESTPAQAKSIHESERAILRRLISLRCVPIHVSRPRHGASVHYAGTIPFSDRDAPFTCDGSGRLHGSRNVHVADSSTWKFLPAKGLTFTLMANARCVAREAVAGLQG